MLCDETREENDGGFVIGVWRQRGPLKENCDPVGTSLIHETTEERLKRKKQTKHGNPRQRFLHVQLLISTIISLYFQTVLGYKYRLCKYSCGQTTTTLLFSPDDSYFNKCSPWATQSLVCISMLFVCACACTRSYRWMFSSITLYLIFWDKGFFLNLELTIQLGCLTWILLPLLPQSCG